MRLSLRFVVPLLVALAVFAYALVPLVDRLMVGWFVRDLDSRATIVANTVREPLGALVLAGNAGGIVSYLTSLTEDERLYAVGWCATATSRPVSTRPWPDSLTCARAQGASADHAASVGGRNGALHVSAVPIESDNGAAGTLVLVHDMGFISRRSADTRHYLFYLFVGLGFVVSLITVAIAQLSWRGWVGGIRALMSGEGLLRAGVKEAPELRPVAKDLRALIHEIDQSRRVADSDHVSWTPAALRNILRDNLRGHEIIVVANRQPYIHVRKNGQVTVQRPASGLVTALEPVMRACSGTWIAHGNGSADEEVVDIHDRVGVPPASPSYQLRRIWLTPEEEAGYYYGFANEGLWPLCHIAHVRPTFRSDDWAAYKKVNASFARAVVDEAKSPDPIVLVQDYHFALLPRLLREALPAATILTFWHIPWPNPEAFAICPWREELLDGLLGSSVLGFHTQFHCNNFVDTVERVLEARVDRETFNVTYRGQPTAVNRYPISVEWPSPPALRAEPVESARAEIRRMNGFPDDHRIGVGIDRLDYTKGIEERFNAVERLFDLHPQWVGKFSFVQIAAPSRSRIENYEDYDRRVRRLAERINARFPGASPPPIVLKVAHHEPDEVYRYYRAADLCFVSSLHDGMNLVAKEFVAARDDERGVLVLSRFTGAARELPEALVVNPYDADECAHALDQALEMGAAEQRERMRLMRGFVQEFNVYRWAGRMLLDAAVLRRRGRVSGALDRAS